MTVELVALTPVIFLFALFAIGLGRYEVAREAVVGATRAAADAAAVASSAYDAPAAANSVASSSGAQGVPSSCTGLSVTTDTSQFFPGGSVSVRVSCRVDFSDLLMPGLPGAATISDDEVAPIDPYRSVQ